MTTIIRSVAVYMELKGDDVFILEPLRKGSRKLSASVMPDKECKGDVALPYAKVPLAIRRAAKAHFRLASPQWLTKG